MVAIAPGSHLHNQNQGQIAGGGLLVRVATWEFCHTSIFHLFCFSLGKKNIPEIPPHTLLSTTPSFISRWPK
jgi:hypothetical protein